MTGLNMSSIIILKTNVYVNLHVLDTVIQTLIKHYTKEKGYFDNLV